MWFDSSIRISDFGKVPHTTIRSGSKVLMRCERDGVRPKSNEEQFPMPYRPESTKRRPASRLKSYRLQRLLHYFGSGPSRSSRGRRTDKISNTTVVLWCSKEGKPLGSSHSRGFVVSLMQRGYIPLQSEDLSRSSCGFKLRPEVHSNTMRDFGNLACFGHSIA